MAAITAIHASTPSLQMRLLQARALLARQEADTAQAQAIRLRQQATQAEQALQEKRSTAQTRAQELRQAQNQTDATPDNDNALASTRFLQRLESAKTRLSVEAYTHLASLQAKASTPSRNTLLHISA
ncbi:MAG: hypothetical protein ACT4NV_08940 [Rhodoferax sp.]